MQLQPNDLLLPHMRAGRQGEGNGGKKWALRRDGWRRAGLEAPGRAGARARHGRPDLNARHSPLSLTSRQCASTTAQSPRTRKLHSSSSHSSHEGVA